MRNFLVYTSAGQSNNVRRWIGPGARSYDLWVTNYSDQPELLKDVADFYNERKGAKFPNFKYIVDHHRDQLERYQGIMVMDDDIVISPQKIEGLFRQLSEQKLWIITPAFSRLGKISHDTTARQLASRYRHTNFAEVTCPLFRADKLLDFMDVYDPELTCYGVDWWYLNHINDNAKSKIVISDEFFCINPRDVQKHSRVREIDKCVSEDERVAAWRKIQDIKGVTSFRKEIFERKRANLFTVVVRLPGYLLERGLDSLLKGSFLTPIKKLIKQFTSRSGRKRS